MCSGPSCFLSKAFSGVWLQQRLVVVLNGFVRCRMAQPQMLAAACVCALSWVNEGSSFLNVRLLQPQEEGHSVATEGSFNVSLIT